MTIVLDGVDLFAIFAGIAVVFYVARDFWEDMQ